MRFAVSALLVSLVGGSAALHAQAPARFATYEHCKFADDLALVEKTPLPDGVQGRTVQTIMGPRQVPLTGGTRLLFAYPQTEPFANVKIEQIPASSYTQAKQDLIANFEQILTGDDSSTRNYALKPKLNGLEIYGLDRKRLEGGVLGIYLFFLDRTHTVTTVYFLNQDPAVRSFTSLESYAALRDTFLNAYTSCEAGAPRSRTEPAREAAVPALPAIPAVSAPSPASASSLPEAPTVQPSAAAHVAASAPGVTESAPYVPPEAAPLVAHPPKPVHPPSANAKKVAQKQPAATVHKAKPATTTPAARKGAKAPAHKSAKRPIPSKAGSSSN